MADYKLLVDGSIQRLIDMAVIPSNVLNRDYAEFLAWVKAGGVADPANAITAPVPASISDRQFFQQLATDGIITEDQALASNAAIIPAPLLAIIDQMPAEQRFSVKMLVSGATTFERDNDVTIAIGEAYGMSPDDIDAFFIAAAAL